MDDKLKAAAEMLFSGSWLKNSDGTMFPAHFAEPGCLWKLSLKDILQFFNDACIYFNIEVSPEVKELTEKYLPQKAPYRGLFSVHRFKDYPEKLAYLVFSVMSFFEDDIIADIDEDPYSAYDDTHLRSIMLGELLAFISRHDIDCSKEFKDYLDVLGICNLAADAYDRNRIKSGKEYCRFNYSPMRPKNINNCLPNWDKVIVTIQDAMKEVFLMKKLLKEMGTQEITPESAVYMLQIYLHILNGALNYTAQQVVGANAAPFDNYGMTSEVFKYLKDSEHLSIYIPGVIRSLFNNYFEYTVSEEIPDPATYVASETMSDEEYRDTYFFACDSDLT